jgi:hypothetical protein
MITLTNPILVPNSLGGTTHASYNKLRIRSIQSDPVTMVITAQAEIMVSSDPTQPIITGGLTIVASGGTPNVVLQMPTLNFFATISLSGAALTTVQGWVSTLQNSIESGLVSQALVTGTQSAGT